MANDGSTVKGTVTNANEQGFQLHGQERWYNWSKYALEPRVYPAPGMVVSVDLDIRGYVRQVRTQGSVSKSDVAQHTEQQPAALQHSYDARLRLDCLKLALEMPVSWSPQMDSVGAALDRAALIEAWAKGDYQ